MDKKTSGLFHNTHTHTHWNGKILQFKKLEIGKIHSWTGGRKSGRRKMPYVSMDSGH